MDLGDGTAFRSLEPQGMIDHIYDLPHQLEHAWKSGMDLPLPEMQGLNSILITGMGSSAVGADLLAAYVAPHCPIPLQVHRGYDLPAWANGPQTLVIACSYSGNTEETLAVYEQAQARNCRTLAVATGGRLAEMGKAARSPVWLFQPDRPPRASVGYTFGLLLSAFFRLGLLPDPIDELRETLHAMRNQQTNLLAEVPVAFNPAKRLAGQLMGRWVVVLAADHLEPVARRWKTQINEIARAWGQFEFLPEADHNSLAGVNNPETALLQTIALFLEARSNHPRNLLRLNLTRQIFMTQGLNTDTIQAKGETLLAHMWTLLHFGDYVSYYLAMSYGEDPTSGDILTTFEDELGKTK
jgi:glucose/mannose-6-phosphate isomerase